MGQDTATTFPETDPISNVPIRTAMFDGPAADQLGNITRTWVLYFQGLATGGSGGGTPGPQGPPGLPGLPGASGSSGTVNPDFKLPLITGAIRTITRTLAEFAGESTSVAFFGVTGAPDPTTGLPIDESAEMQLAVNTMAANGGWLRIPAGFDIYLGMPISIPSNLRLIGDGANLSRLLLFADLPTGFGILDFGVNVENVDVIGIGIDGRTGDNVTGALRGTTGIDYTMAGDVSDAQWTNNSSIWIHEGCNNLRFQDLNINHTGGYAIFGRAASSKNITDISILHCSFTNNRPFLSGPPGDTSYGTVGGGVLLWNDGSTAFFQRITVDDCSWFKSTGNCFWTHAYSISYPAFFNRQVVFTNNYGEDLGLDMTQMVGDGYIETDNQVVRCGYICLDDDGLTRTPRWYVIPVAFDTAGKLLNAVRNNNQVSAGNCEMFDLDGCGWTTVSNNVFESSFVSSDPLADAAHCGPWNALGLNFTRGILGSNSNGAPDVGTYMIVVGNEFYGAAGGAIGGFGWQHSKIMGNLIEYPDTYYSAPVLLGNLIIGGVQFRAFDNDVSGNTFHISATGASGPCVAETDGPGGAMPPTPFQPTDVNRILNNTFSSQFFEFLKRPLSSGTTGITAIASTTAQAQGIVETHILTQGINTASFQMQLWSNSVASIGVAPTGSQMATITPAASFFPALGIGATGIVDPAFNFTGHSFTITGAANPLIIDAAGNGTFRALAIGTATPNDLISNVSTGTHVQDAQPIHTSEGHGITWQGSSGGYIAGFENTDAIPNANGLLVKVRDNTAATRAFTINVNGSDLFAVSALGFTTAQAYSIGTAGVITATRDSYLNSVSVGTAAVAATAAGLAIASDKTAYLSQVYIGNLGGSPIQVIDNTGTYIGPLHPVSLSVGAPTYTAGVPLISQSHGNFANTGADQSAVVGLLGPAATSITAVLEYFHPFATDHLISDSAGAFGAIIPAGAVGWEGNAVSAMVVALNPSNVPANTIGSCAGRFYALGGVNGATVWTLNTLLRDFAFGDYTGHSYAANLIGNEMDTNVSNMGSTYTGLNINIAWLTPGFAHPTSHANTAMNIGGGTNPAYWDKGIDFNNGNCDVAIRIGLRPPVLSINSQFVNWTSGSGGVYETTMYADALGQFVIIPNHNGTGGVTPHALVLDPVGTVQANAFGINGNGVVHADRNIFGHSFNLQPDFYTNGVFYSVGSMIVDSNGHRQFVQTAGTSQSSGHPTWSTSGGVVVDNFGSGPLVWRDAGATAAIATVDSFNNAIVASLKIGPDVVTNPFAAAITVNTVVRMDLAGDCNFNAINIAGSPFVTTGLAITGTSLNVGSGTVTCGTLAVGTFSPAIVNATNQYQMNGASIVNSSGQWIGGAVIISAGIQCGGMTSTTAGINLGSQGITCGGMTINGILAAGSNVVQCGRVDPAGGHTGQTVNVTFTSGFTISGSLFHTLIYVGGVLVSFA